MRINPSILVVFLFVLAATVGFEQPHSLRAAEPCCIRVIDKSNGWPVPLVELTTTHNVRFVTDNAGVIAFDLPELMNVPTWFTLKGHGYMVPRDGFGFEGVRLIPRAGETLTVEVTRQLPGKRLGRITGGGIFAESQKLGRELDWTEQGILGCDSVQNVEHNGRLHWGWGDTTLPGYPLGIFHMLGATTVSRPLETLEPPVRLRYDYFRDADGKPRATAQLPGDGPTWLGGYASLADHQGTMHLVATYAKIKPPLDAYEYGLCEWDEKEQRFVKKKVLWTSSQSADKDPQYPLGHNVEWTDKQGKSWVLFGDPFPTLMYPNAYESWLNPDTWVKLEAQKEIGVHSSQEKIKPHRGAIAWNAYRNKWITVFTQLDGKRSLLGELWYAEAEAPQGPWSNAVQVVTHDDYTFYNPQLHAGFSDPDSSILLFEATYTKEFSGTKSPTPRHDYNQVLYRLDLDDPAFKF
jgi:hypothetical protein